MGVNCAQIVFQNRCSRQRRSPSGQLVSVGLNTLPCLHLTTYQTRGLWANLLILNFKRYIKNKKPCFCTTAYMKVFLQIPIENRIKVWETKAQVNCAWNVLFLQNRCSSPRSISIGQLNTLPCLHLRPIKLVVYKWPYFLKGMGYLILRCVSRLDAFSVYHIRTRLPGYAPGGTTDAPEVRPTRSSRTKVSSSQISNAHDR